MELKPLTPQLDELRNVVISSGLTSCYILIEELTTARGERMNYEKFKAHWIDMYKSTYTLVSKMKVRRTPRSR